MKENHYFVYILKSVNHNRIYIGSAQDVETRLLLHNRGRVRSTKTYTPWALLEKHSFDTRSEAVKNELYFKTGQQREIIRRRYGL